MKKIHAMLKTLANNKILKNIVIICGIIFTFLFFDVGLRIISNEYINFYPFDTKAPLFFSVSYVVLLILIIYLVPKKIGIILYGTTTIISSILTLAQILHLKILGRFFGPYDLFLAKEGSDYFLYAIKQINIGILLLILIPILSMIFIAKIINSTNNRKTLKYYLILLIICLPLIYTFRTGAFNSLGEKTYDGAWDAWQNPKNVYLDYNNQSKNMEVSGLYEHIFRNLYLIIENKFSDNNEEIKKLDEYFKKRNLKNDTNEYTSIFKNKNLILIMLESIDNWLVTPEIMPTLYTIQNEGINFVNRYSPNFGGGYTFNSEFAVNTGLYSPNNGNASYNYDNNDFSYSLPNLFKNSGYSVNSFHYNFGNFYNRNSIHLALGYENHYALKDKFRSVDFTDDRNLVDFDDSYNLIVPDKQKFMSFIITYSAHVPYDDTNPLCTNNIDENSNLYVNDNYELTCIQTLANLTDQFLQKLITKLEDNNRLEDTVLVLYSDHYAYGYSDIQNIKGFDNINLLQNTPFIIWNRNIESSIVETYMDTVDILPTIANMFDLQYNPNYYMGTDVFSPYHENFVYFNDYSWMNKDIYYNGYETDYIDKEYISSIVSEKITINDSILKNNYYKYSKK